MRTIMPAALATVSLFVVATGVSAQAPQGYPADYSKIVEAAKKEGKVLVSATTDAVAANPLIVTAVVTVVGAVGLTTCLIAARRGLSLNPAAALRDE